MLLWLQNLLSLGKLNHSQSRCLEGQLCQGLWATLVSYIAMPFDVRSKNLFQNSPTVLLSVKLSHGYGWFAFGINQVWLQSHVFNLPKTLSMLSALKKACFCMKLHTIWSFISALRKALTKQKHRTTVHETPIAYLLHLYVTVWEDLKGGPPLIPLLQLQAGKCFSSKSRFSCLLSSRPLCCVILLFSTVVISDAHGSQTM